MTAVSVCSGRGLSPTAGVNVSTTAVNWARIVSAAAVFAADSSINGGSVEAGKLHATKPIRKINNASVSGDLFIRIILILSIQ
jgi:hypothetical protein